MQEGKIYEGLPELISNAMLEDDNINHCHLQSQEEAVEAVRKDMKNLCDLVAQSLEERQISCRIFHPHTFMTGNDSSFEADLEAIFETVHYGHSEFLKSATFGYTSAHSAVVSNNSKRIIPILHGDVVDVLGTAKFGILSGDHIAERLVQESFRRNKNPESGNGGNGKIWQKIHMVFAMTDVPGLMSHPPGHPDSILISKWNPDHSATDDILLDETRLKHNSKIDVTGGIALKLDVASKMTEYTDHIWILDGRQPKRIIEAVLDASTEGTLISRH